MPIRIRGCVEMRRDSYVLGSGDDDDLSGEVLQVCLWVEFGGPHRAQSFGYALMWLRSIAMPRVFIEEHGRLS